MTESPVAEWRIHLGAHKTATTHLQDSLAVARDSLLAQGVDYLPRDDVRAVFGRVLSRRRWQYHLGGAAIRRDLQGALQPLRQGGRCVALSEENLIGACRDLISPVPYPRAAAQARRLATLTATAPLTLFLSIRGFDRVLPGAYATALRFRNVTPTDLASLRHGFAATPPSWITLIEAIGRAAPQARLRVWRYEDYAADPLGIAAAFVGLPQPALPALPPPATTRTPSADAVAEVERMQTSLPAAMARPQFMQAVDAVYARLPADAAAGRARYMPFGEDEIRALQAAYARDTDTIRQRWPGMLIEPAPSA